MRVLSYSTTQDYLPEGFSVALADGALAVGGHCPVAGHDDHVGAVEDDVGALARAARGLPQQGAYARGALHQARQVHAVALARALQRWRVPERSRRMM